MRLLPLFISGYANGQQSTQQKCFFLECVTVSNVVLVLFYITIDVPDPV